MGCNCGKKAGSLVYVYTSPAGNTQTYNSEIEAKAAKIRAGGGSYTTQSR